MPSAPVRAVLWGRDHQEYRDVAIEAAGDRAAVALTRGFYPKPYRWTDRNEDVAAVVVGERATLLVVADGHNGVPAPEIAVEAVLDRFGGDPPAPGVDDEELVDLVHEASTEILARTTSGPARHRQSRTTLLFAFAGGGEVQWAGLGDSALVVASAGGGRELSRAAHRFVGYPMPRAAVKGLLDRGQARLHPDEWVVLVTDGFTNFVHPAPHDVVARAVASASDPTAAARRLIERAGEGGAGDNVGVALLAPPPAT